MAIVHCGHCGAILPAQTGPSLACRYGGTPQTSDEPAPARVWLRDDWVITLLCQNVTGVDYTWIHPSIPATKLANVRALHAAHLPPAKTVLAIYDGTVFGSARAGFVVTAQRLCWKNQLEEPQFLDWIHVPPGGVTVDEKRIAVANARLDTFFAVRHPHLWARAKVMDTLAKATQAVPSMPPPRAPCGEAMPWHAAIPYTNPHTAPLVPHAEAVRAVDVAWERLEATSDASSSEYVHIAQWLHYGFRVPDSVDARAFKAETLIMAQRFPEAGEAMSGLPVDH